MDDPNKIGSSELIALVLDPHIELATSLIKLVRSRNTGDPTHRFQIAAIIVFLAGIDKSLSLALQLSYLTGAVTLKWMSGGRDMEAGVIECRPGFMKKLKKLYELGLDETDLEWITRLRNDYIHGCSITARYKFHFESDADKKPAVLLNAVGPIIETYGPPLLSIGATELQQDAARLKAGLAKYLDGIAWKSVWLNVQQELKHLPTNPEPEYTQGAEMLANLEFEPLESLNSRYIGIGLNKVLNRL